MLGTAGIRAYVCGRGHRPTCLRQWAGFTRFLESPGVFFGKFPGPGKSWKMSLVVESRGNLLASSWKVL